MIIALIMRIVLGGPRREGERAAETGRTGAAARAADRGRRRLAWIRVDPCGCSRRHPACGRPRHP